MLKISKVFYDNWQIIKHHSTYIQFMLVVTENKETTVYEGKLGLCLETC